MTTANRSIVIHIDTNPDGSLRVRTIPPLTELLQLTDQSLASLTTAELYGLAAMQGAKDMQERMQAAHSAL